MTVASTIWERLRDPHPQAASPRKMVWKLLRQFRSATEMATEFGESPRFLWQPTQSSHDQGATKLLLVNSHGIRCEAVALYPGAIQRSNEHPPATTPPPNTLTDASSWHPHQQKLPRATACISSQPGCGVGCPFCATGELGYRGNLTADEILEQVYWIGHTARLVHRRLRNVVFMGMGEPLHNTENVLAAIDQLTASRAFGIPQRRIMVSTAGVPSGMLRLAKRFPDVRLALSLHAAEPHLRRTLVPRAVGDLSLLKQTIRQVNALQPTHPVWLEVVLFENINDSPEHARQLLEFCGGLRVEVNLIPYNTAAAPDIFRPSPWSVREDFAKALRASGIRTSIRSSLGQSRNAACGQLNALHPHDRVAEQ